MATKDGPQGNSLSIGAENKFTEEIFLDIGQDGYLSLEGLSDSTVTLQYRKPGDTTWYDQDTETTAGLYTFEGCGKFWKAGVATGDYGTDTILVNISG